MSDLVPSSSPSPTTTDPLDEAGGRALVEAWLASGLSGAAYCRLHQLRPQRLHYWRERLGYPIRVVGEQSQERSGHPPGATGFVRMVVDAGPVTSHVDIVVGGAVIRVQSGFDPVLLRTVIGALHSGA